MDDFRSSLRYSNPRGFQLSAGIKGVIDIFPPVDIRKSLGGFFSLAPVSPLFGPCDRTQNLSFFWCYLSVQHGIWRLHVTNIELWRGEASPSAPLFLLTPAVYSFTPRPVLFCLA